MSKIENPARSVSSSQVSGKKGSFGRSTSESQPSSTIARIKAANRKVKLYNAMCAEGFKPSQPQNNGWSESIACPLVNHKFGRERTASFGYNHNYDRFHCFGCRQTGHAVEFIAGVRGVSRLSIAEDILSRFDDDLEEIELVNESKDVKEILFRLSSKYQKLIVKFRNDPFILEHIQKPLIWIDTYLLINVPKNKLDIQELDARVKKAEDILDSIIGDN